LVLTYVSIVSAPGHFCIAALYKFSMYCMIYTRGRCCCDSRSYCMTRTPMSVKHDDQGA